LTSPHERQKEQKGRVFPALSQTEGIPNCDSNMSPARKGKPEFAYYLEVVADQRERGEFA
jgi:hypothetical protein